jgi:hypothetical protein
MVVQRKYWIRLIFEPSAHFVQNIERKGLPPDVELRVTGQFGPDATERIDELTRGVNSAQARLPGDRQTMIGRRNAVVDQLVVGFPQGDVHRKRHARPGLNLSLKSIAVNIHDSRQNQQLAGINHRSYLPVIFDDEPVLQHKSVGPQPCTTENFTTFQMPNHLNTHVKIM